jgi:hypothetical protein
MVSRGGHCGRMIGAHRAAWLVTHGEIPEGQEVCHRCDNPPCCNPAHLFLGSHAENVQDSFSKGRGAANLPRDNRGAKNGRARLTEASVNEIRARYGSVTARQLATELGVSIYTVRAVAQNRIWRHLPLRNEAA